MENIFLEKLYTEDGVETRPRNHSKKLKLRTAMKYWNWPLVFNSSKAFLKKAPSGLEVVSLPHFLIDFWRKMFLLIYSISWPILFHSLYFLRFAQYMSDNYCFLVYDFKKFEIKDSYQPVFLQDTKSQDKNWNILRRKELVRWNKEYFPLLSKNVHWSKQLF